MQEKNRVSSVRQGSLLTLLLGVCSLMLLGAAHPVMADEVSISGSTTGVITGVPSLTFTGNTAFTSTTALGDSSLSGANSLGSFFLSSAPTQAVNGNFTLTINFSGPTGINGGQSATYTASIQGSISPNINQGGVFIHFNFPAQTFTFNDGINIGSFTLILADTFVQAGQSSSLTAGLTGSQSLNQNQVQVKTIGLQSTLPTGNGSAKSVSVKSVDEELTIYGSSTGVVTGTPSLVFVGNSFFMGTTALGTGSLSGSNSLGSFLLSSAPTQSIAGSFTLDISFWGPTGISGGQNTTYTASIQGSVSPNIDQGGVLIHFATPAQTFTFDDGFSSGSFTLTLADTFVQTGRSSDLTAGFTGSQIFVPPITVSNISVSVNEDTSASFSAAFFDGGFSGGPAGTTLQKVKILSLPNNGTLTLNGVAVTLNQQIARDDLDELVYTPNPNFNGVDFIDWNGSDIEAYAEISASIIITVNPVNDTPTAEGQSATTNEDTAKGLILSGDDGDPEANQSLTYTIDSQPTHGTLSNFNAATGEVTYTPGANYNGPDSFTFTVTDNGASGGTPRSVSRAALSKSATGDEPLTSAPATVNITVNAVNDAPVAQGQSVTTDEDTLKSITLSGNDGDEGVTQSLTFAIATNPAHGTLSGFNASTGAVIYTPTANYNGPDSFTFTVTDDNTAGGEPLTGTPATVSITVNPVNDAPVADGQLVTANEDTAASLTLTGADGDAEVNQTLTFAIAANPAHGTLSGFNAATGAVTYTPDASYNGPDSFTFTVTDDNTAGGAALTSTAATVSIKIAPVNDVPGADGQSVTTDEDTAKSLTLTGNDGDPGVTQSLTFAIAANPAHGTLSGLNSSTGAVTYTPGANYNGPDSFTFTVTDDNTAGGEQRTSAPATVSITVSPVNDAPTANAQSVTTDEDTAKNIALSGSDNDAGVNQTLTFAVVSGPVHGTLSGTGANRTYTPDANYNGPDSFTFTVTDDDTTAGGAALTSAAATINITVTPINDAPSANGQSVTTNEDTAKAITLIGTDGDSEVNQALTFAIASTPTHGTLSGLNPATRAVIYTPGANYNGSDSFTFTVTDDTTAGGAALTSIAATVNITISAVNDAPSFTKGANQTVNEDAGPQTVTNWATNISTGPANEAGQTLTFLVSNNNTALFSVQPTLSATGTLTYTPASDASGMAIVTLRLRDNGGTANGGVNTSAAQTFTITVLALNDAPSVNGQSVTTDEDTAKNLTLTGSDGDPEVNQTLTFAIATNPAHGTLSGFNAATGTVTYTPDANYNGPDSFTFTVTDDNTAGGVALTSAAATVSITVNPVNDVPSADGQSVTTNEDTTKNLILTGSDGDADVNQTLTFAIATAPTHGTLSGFDTTTGVVTYTPSANYNGPDSFTFTITDDNTAGGAALTSTATTVSITVSPVNDAPSFTKGADQTVNEDAGPQVVAGWATNLSAGPVNEAGQTLTFLVSNNNNALFSTQPSINGSGVLSFTPASNVSGTALVAVRLRDSGGTANGGVNTSAVQRFTITVNPVNDAPRANEQSFSTDEDTAKNVTLTGSDGDAEVNQTLTFAIATNPAHGTLSGLNTNTGAVTYTPTANYNGPDSFTFTVTDDNTAGGAPLTSEPVIVSIKVNPINDIPVANGQSTTTNEDNAKSLTLTGTDSDPEMNQTLTFAIASAPGHGTLSGFNAVTGAVTYTPDANYNGPDSFTFTVADDDTAGGAPLISAPGTVSITVRPVNDAPTANGQSVTTNEDTAKSIALTGNDNDAGVNQTLTFAVVSGPAHGSLSGTGANRTYTPNANYNGPDSFTFKVTDDTTAGGAALTSAAATINITVTPVNDTPTAKDQSVSTNEDVAKSITLSGDDSDADVNQTLTFAIATNPAHGTLSGFNAATGAVTYRPSANYNGPDSFTFTVADDDTAGGAALISTPGTVSITVNPVNDVPRANAQLVATNEDVAKSITLTGSDGDAEITQTLIFAIATNPTHGTLSGLNSATGTVTYTPDTNYNGSDSFSFTVTDDNAAGSAARTSVAARVSITVAPVNDAPGANGQSVTTDEDTAKTLTLTGSDGDPEVNQTLTFAITTNPSHGTLSGFNAATGAVTYTPTANYNGPDSFTFKVTDDNAAGGAALTSNAAKVTITVSPLNDAPTANEQSIITNEDTSKNITLTGTDGDADVNQTLTFAIASNPGHGTLSGFNSATGSVTYTPDANYNGPDSFTFKVTDDNAAGGEQQTSAVATISITVIPINDAPGADGQSVSTNEDTVKNIVLSGSDGDVEANQTLAFAIATNPSHGTLSGLNATTGAVTYTPSANYNGPDSFTFTVTDDTTAGGAALISAPATVSITVSPVNDVPSFTKGANQTVNEDAGPQVVTNWATNLSAGPVNEAGQTLTFIVTTNNPGLFSAKPTLDATGKLTYTAAPNANGTATVIVRIKDNGGTQNGGVDTSAAQTFTIRITPVNDAPVNTVPGTQNMSEGATLVFSGATSNRISISDVDAGSGIVQVQLAVTHGKLTLGSTAGLATLTGNGTANLLAKGTLTALNSALDGLRYDPAESSCGDVHRLTINTSDLGLTGAGGPLSDVDSVAIRVKDTTSPTIICPLDITRDSDADKCSAVITIARVYGEDNCDGRIEAQGERDDGKALNDPYPVGTTQIHWVLEDSSGNFAESCYQTITVLDKQLPTIQCPANVTVGTNPGQCSARNVALGRPTVDDNCGVKSITNNAPTEFPKGITTVTWKVTDIHGNQATCQQQVKVEDRENPVITCPPDLTVPQDSAFGATVRYTVTATDNCPGVTVVSVPSSGSAFPLGTTTVNCTATDESGRKATCSFKVTVVPPPSTCPAKVTGGGYILDKVGGKAYLELNPQTVNGDCVAKGKMNYKDASEGIDVRSTLLTSLVVTGTRARLFGKATVNGVGSYDFMVEVEDLGEPGQADKFSIQLNWGGGYAHNGTVAGGNIQVFK